MDTEDPFQSLFSGSVRVLWFEAGVRLLMTESISALIMAFRDLVFPCEASLALSSSQCVLGGCLGTREQMCGVSQGTSGGTDW